MAWITRARSYMGSGARYSSCFSLECSHRRFQEATTRSQIREDVTTSIVHACIMLHSWRTGLANQIGEPGFKSLTFHFLSNRAPPANIFLCFLSLPPAGVTKSQLFCVWGKCCTSTTEGSQRVLSALSHRNFERILHYRVMLGGTKAWALMDCPQNLQ